MRKQRHTAPGGGQNLGRVGALGVLAAGALCAAVLSVASRVPPTPIDLDRIPSVEVGGAIEGEATPAVRHARRSDSRRRDGKRGSDGQDRASRRAGKGDSPGRGSRGERARAGGSALPTAYGDSGGGEQNAVAGPRPGGSDGGSGSERPVSGPGGGSDGGSGSERPVSGPGGGSGGDAADDDEADPTLTAASEDDGESEGEEEVETDPAPAAAIPAPTLARSGDSDDE
jgi:hypothetical protein